MGSTKKQMKKFTIQDGIKVAAVVGAALVLVVGAAAAVEHLPSKRRDPVELTPAVTTPAVVSEDAVVTEPVTEATPEVTSVPTTPEVTTEPTTAPPETAPEPTTTPAPTTTATEKTTKATKKTEAATTTAAAETTAAEEPEEADDNRPLSEMKYNNDIKNIVFLGTDRNSVGENYFYRTGGQSDTIMILSMDLKKKEYFVVIVNRNMVVPVQTYDRYGQSLGIENQQICLAHAYGDGSRVSAFNTLLSLSSLLGEDIKYLGFIEMPMTNIGPINDLFGGVTVTIEDDFSGLYNSGGKPWAAINSVDFAKGNSVTLKGDQAEAYLRARNGMDNISNTARMRRQKTYLAALKTKIKSEMSAKQLLDIYDKTLDMTMTDMGKKDITKWITAIYDYDFKDFYYLQGIEGERVMNASAYYPDEAELEAIQRLYYK